ncbi:DUF2264 domain-containing protein [Anaerocolumna xylanovorans]|uniref:DUF2264 domain-containing protein n=1 Tax=Anaerocolumna xylanovorans DSM 12503 TaxID=1121345 RepID=A0A1M7YHL0_9FIRM|nr:DUF2264 domain-containing protein [Anaerocolumna xylanovorans]SHO52134.1 hypothetical protein SAMN02745217_03523 [Anaerocolumna xylanovorans DSM 12503]
MKFELRNPDYTLSPYTGMGRQHWLDACEFLLKGIFSNVASMDSLPLSPRTEYAVSYPNEKTSPWKEYAARFEGLSRSFLIAAPLLFNRPETKIGEYSLTEYYRKHILSAVTKGTASYMLSLKEVQSMSAPGERAFQHTCECASLVIGLEQSRNILWDTYCQQEKDCIAAYLMEFANGYTEPHNWRLFNMLILAFLHKEGYPIDESIMRDHAQAILSYYAGDGWYRDGHRFDYYSPWAFQVYAPLWNAWYGYQKEPYIASQIEKNSNCLVERYEALFDKNANVTLWGRSGIYRNAVSAPFAANFALNNPKAHPGLARRINSGALLQFITREDVFQNGIPTLGFYKEFSPMVQEYSCAESPFWMANPFICLCFPDNHPFWTAAESNGSWEEMKENANKTFIMEGPGIVADHHGANGSVEFRTAKALFKPEDEYIPYYIRLSFHSHFPWEAFDYKGAEAMQYSLLYDGEEKALVPNIMLYAGVREKVLYRMAYFDFQYNFQGKSSIQLADIPLPNGMLRADKTRIPHKPYRLFMGAYGFPADDTVSIQKRSLNGAQSMVLKSDTRQLALTVYSGFDTIELKERTGVNPISAKSLLLYGTSKREKLYGYEPYVMVSAVLSKEGGEDFTESELFPIRSLSFRDSEQCGGCGPVRIELRDGQSYEINYEEMEGNLMI